MILILLWLVSLTDWLYLCQSGCLMDKFIWLPDLLTVCLTDFMTYWPSVSLIVCLTVCLWLSGLVNVSWHWLLQSLFRLCLTHFLPYWQVIFCLRLLAINRFRLFYFLGKVEVVFVVLTNVDSLEVRIVEFKNRPM